MISVKNMVFYNRNKIWKIKNLKISVILEPDVN